MVTPFGLVAQERHLPGAQTTTLFTRVVSELCQKLALTTVALDLFSEQGLQKW